MFFAIFVAPQLVPRKFWEILIDKFDIKRWVLAREKGKHGLDHWQIRIEASGGEEQRNQIFEFCKKSYPSIHMEKSEKWSDYERKESHFWTSMDTWEVSKQRFAPLRKGQEQLLKAVYKENDRQIVVWYNPEGNVGKSWLIGALWERGIAHFVPVELSLSKMIQDVAAEYIINGWRDIIVIDIPKTIKWDNDLYTALERIKDGLIKDTRYSPHPINIRGVKILVTTNTLPSKNKLSADRLIIIRRDQK